MDILYYTLYTSVEVIITADYRDQKHYMLDILTKWQGEI